MYLSRIYLDTTNPDTEEAMENREKLHGAVEAACGNDGSRNLWRIDESSSRSGIRTMLLIMSGKMPDMAGIQEQFGFPDGPGQTVDYDRVLRHTVTGSSWRFRLSAVPTVCKAAEEGRGEKRSIVDSEGKRNWLLTRDEGLGFEILPENLFVSASEKYAFTKKGREDRKKHEVIFYAADYEGILTVTDEELFRRTMAAGIGREKAYGMGMMTLARV